MLMLFPRFDKLSAPKNTNATFFELEEVYLKYYVRKLKIHFVDACDIQI